ncbi:hypothetical protein BC827DRAFT_1254102 [Russula dissimulans]|nr:hypothetical protein BC827DRAFT_1254102 [Russula dissimulans]
MFTYTSSPVHPGMAFIGRYFVLLLCCVEARSFSGTPRRYTSIGLVTYIHGRNRRWQRAMRTHSSYPRLPFSTRTFYPPPLYAESSSKADSCSTTLGPPPTIFSLPTIKTQHRSKKSMFTAISTLGFG